MHIVACIVEILRYLGYYINNSKFIHQNTHIFPRITHNLFKDVKILTRLYAYGTSPPIDEWKIYNFALLTPETANPSMQYSGMPCIMRSL